MFASRRGIVLALVLPAAMLIGVAFPGAAFGDGEGAPAKKKLPPAADVKYDPDNIVAISQFEEAASKGTQLYMQKDYAAAVETFRKAMQLAPRNALGPYLLAEAYLAQGNLGEADAAIASAVDLAPTDTKPTSTFTRAKILFLRADIYERQKMWDQAKTAWQIYVEAANRVPADGGAYPQSGQERMQVIQKTLDLDKKYVAVRERIAAEKAGDAGKTAPPPKKK
jgi:tetratricopeptide (TPR) repeat protein